jgi:hypothetical protein
MRRDAKSAGRPRDPESERGLARQLTREKVRALRLKNDREARLLIPIEEAQREGFTAIRVIREAILNVPPGIAAELEGLPAVEILARLEARLRLALEAAEQGILRA